jgi:hypothetical protein
MRVKSSPENRKIPNVGRKLSNESRKLLNEGSRNQKWIAGKSLDRNWKDCGNWT